MKSTPVPTPNARQLAWQDLELGLAYHFDLDVYMPGGHDHERSRREALDASLYRPDELDTDQWLAAARDAGAGYAILTATHHQGFLQWQSDLYPFGLKQAPWRNGKGDLVADFAASCRRFGIVPGIYIGIRFNAYWQVYGYEVNGGRGGDTAARSRYMDLCERMVEELCTRYGEWCEVWFDGGVITPEAGGPDLLPIVRRHQPNAVYYHSPQCAEHRWVGSETGTTGDPCWATLPSVASHYAAHGHNDKEHFRVLAHGDPNGAVWCPGMSDAPIRDHDWLWRPNREDRLFGADDLMDMYVASVGRNSNLILGAVPDRRGLIPDADVEVYRAFGERLRKRFGTPLAETRGEGDCLVLRLPVATPLHDIVVQEDIRYGERVRQFVLESAGSDEQWTPLFQGTCIGHKRIVPLGPTEPHCAIRLRVTEAVAMPRIRCLAAYGNS